MTILELNVESTPEAQESWKAPQIPRILGQELPHEQLVIFVRHAESRWNRAQAGNVGRWLDHTFLASCDKDSRNDNLDVDTTSRAHSWEGLHHCMWGRIDECYDIITRDTSVMTHAHFVFHRLRVNQFFH